MLTLPRFPWMIALTTACAVSAAEGRPPRDVFPGRLYEVGDAPMAMKAADVDGDSDLDLIIANRDSRDISVLRRTVFAGFLPEVRVPLGVAAEYLDTGDLNGDGRADIVAASSADYAVAVVLTDGAGGFHTVNVYPLSWEPTGVAVGHVDQDGKLDVVFVGQSSGTVRALMNLGDGTMGPPTTIHQSRDSFRFVAAGDLDGDGDHEIVLGPENGVGTLLINTGTGVFSEKPIPGSLSWGAILADMDRDGDRDILAIPAHYAISVIRNNGNATFENADWHDPRISSITDIAAADLDGDGWPEAIVAARSTEISWSNGTGSFENELPPVERDGEGSAVVAHDFDRDGDADIAVAHPDSDVVEVWWNEGDGTFPPKLRTPAYAHTLLKLDFEGDGDLDLIAAPESGSGFTSLLNDGSAGFSPMYPAGSVAPTVTEPDASTAVSRVLWPDLSGVAAGDLNDDGIADLVQSSGPYPGISVRLGTGPGTFGSRSYYPGTYRRTSALVLEDFDLDGDPDVVAALGEDGELGVFLNDSTGAFTSGPFATAPGWIRDIEVSDLDLDGDMDLVCAIPAQDSVAVFWSDGAGGFQVVSLPAGAGPGTLAIGDMNGDDLPDIVAGNDGPDTSEPPDSGVSVLINMGNAAFAPVSTFAAQGACTSVALADLDSDRDLDVVGALSRSFSMRVFLNDGHAALVDGGRYLCGGQPGDGPESIVTGDFNGDSRQDVCVANFFSYALTPVLNQFQQRVLCPADIDGDMYVDASDFNILAAHFGQSVPPSTSGDLNSDGAVNAADFNIFAGDFGCGP